MGQRDGILPVSTPLPYSPALTPKVGWQTNPPMCYLCCRNDCEHYPHSRSDDSGTSRPGFAIPCARVLRTIHRNMNPSLPSHPHASENESPLIPWDQCEVFCIHNYASGATRRCGWRGRRGDATWDTQHGHRVCPRCGQAELLDVRHNAGPDTTFFARPL